MIPPHLGVALIDAFGELDEPVPSRRRMDDRRPVPRNPFGDRTGTGRRCARGRDGSSGALRVRPGQRIETSSVSPTSPTPWRPMATTSRRAPTTAPSGHSVLYRRSHRIGGGRRLRSPPSRTSRLSLEIVPDRLTTSRCLVSPQALLGSALKRGRAELVMAAAVSSREPSSSTLIGLSFTVLSTTTSPRASTCRAWNAVLGGGIGRNGDCYGCASRRRPL